MRTHADPQHPQKKPTMVIHACNPNTMEAERQPLGLTGPSLACLTSSRTARAAVPVFRQEKVGSISMCAVRMHTHPHTQMQTKCFYTYRRDRIEHSFICLWLFPFWEAQHRPVPCSVRKKKKETRIILPKSQFASLVLHICACSVWEPLWLHRDLPFCFVFVCLFGWFSWDWVSL